MDAVEASKMADPPPAAIPPSLPRLLLGLALLLAASAVFQLVYLVPRSMFVVQHFVGQRVPAPLYLASRVPDWAALAAGLLVVAVAVWQRGSLGRLGLLATAALAANVGIFLSVLNSLVSILSRLE